MLLHQEIRLAAVVVVGFLILGVTECSYVGRKGSVFEYAAVSCRAHSFSVTDFGAVGDGKTLNTRAFGEAVNHLSRYSQEGGALLYVPAGRWLTGSFNLTSHFTLFLHRDAVLLASQVEFPLTSFSGGFLLTTA